MCTVRGDDTHAEAVVCEDGEDEEDDDEGHMRMSQMLSKMAVSKKLEMKMLEATRRRHPR